MAYLALYREWRPKTFQNIVGQEHITRTLMNALKQNKIAHAYLFSGPRGTGKTTAAKILAKALNCEQRIDVEPCNQCSSCLSIDHGSAIEVFEIDAASNRGIDEIRDLRENIKLSSIEGRFKVYIIDEVHMLTTEAFNALLKTLEEPPPQVVFILATTEVQKIPLTILSRVQRFEFHRISVENISSRLTLVCESLGRNILPGALQVIAQKSEGGLRDALSILDQCLLQDDPIGVKEVYQVLGMVGETFSSELVESLMTLDYGKSLAILTDGIQQGRDPRQIIRELLDYLRQMLLNVTTGAAPLVAPEIQERLVKQSEQVPISRLLHWISLLMQGEGQLKYASNARLAAELLIVQTIHEGQNIIGEQGEILNRLTLLEKNVQTLLSGKNVHLLNDIKSTHPAEVDHAAEIDHVNNDSSKKKNAIDVKTETTSTEKRVSAGSEILTIENLRERWNDVLDQVRRRKKSTQAFLLEGKPVQLEGNVLTIAFREGCSFHKDKVNQIENRQTIEESLQQIFGMDLSITNVMENEFKIKESSELPDKKQQDQDLIDKAKDMFGEDLVIIKD
ncbi:DNA polymerase III, subunit gamma/tau [Desulfosporosinus acidiphilus SJ4]|uniref:DNA-directed DNA polymerase n=1 Tax=Desulfosporosinus acidiphilus (strain DSM 22704 / JCM 16185 / SJ4) TaxID=646529 RepID=I4D011_DESAJ|nr:DNA polymerase III subunit gamma/tau [Desulfosporosinus acidiphilus]AFM39135.1 DNA polymerase III, subunit gamma/tau [Desulfosporosinus acidiphilus SJ4]